MINEDKETLERIVLVLGIAACIFLAGCGDTHADNNNQKRGSDFHYIPGFNYRNSEVDYYNKGNAHAKKGEYDQAISDYSLAIAIDPRYYQAYSNRGIAYAKKGEHDQAISDYSEAIAIDPRLATAYFNRALVYYVKKDYDKAWADVHKAESLGGQIPPLFLNKLRRVSGSDLLTDFRINMEQLPQDTSEMKEEMKALREKKPWLKDYDRGQALFKKGQFQEALDAFDKALAGDAMLDVAWVFKGRCVFRLGRPQESIQYFDKAIEVSRSTRSSKSWVWWPYYYKGMALNMLRCYDEALDALTRSIESNETARARLTRADVYGGQGKFDLAIKDLDRAIELRPSFIEAYIMRAMAHARHGDKAAALKDVAAVEKQQPRMGRILRPQIEEALRGR